jgi:hypothetical protein
MKVLLEFKDPKKKAKEFIGVNHFEIECEE